VARGHAEILAGASSLVIQPSFDSTVAPRERPDLDHNASVSATPPSSFGRPQATAPSALVSLPSVPTVCPSVSDVFGKIASVAHQAFEVVSSPWVASGCLLGVHPHCIQPRLAGGHAEILAGGSIFAIPSGFDCPVTSGASPDPDSTASAQSQLPSGFEHPPATGRSTIASLPSVSAVCPSMSDLFGGIAQAAHTVFEVVSSLGLLQGALLESTPIALSLIWPQAMPKFWQRLPFSQSHQVLTAQ